MEILELKNSIIEEENSLKALEQIQDIRRKN